MMTDLLQLQNKFRDDKQLWAVQEVVQSRLADDRNQEECRYLMRFWWQLNMTYREVGFEELERHLSPEKFIIICNLLDALNNGYDAIDRWIQKFSEELPIIEDRGFHLYENNA